MKTDPDKTRRVVILITILIVLFMLFGLVLILLDTVEAYNSFRDSPQTPMTNGACTPPVGFALYNNCTLTKSCSDCINTYKCECYGNSGCTGYSDITTDCSGNVLRSTKSDDNPFSGLIPSGLSGWIFVAVIVIPFILFWRTVRRSWF